MPGKLIWAQIERRHELRYFSSRAIIMAWEMKAQIVWVVQMLKSHQQIMADPNFNQLGIERGIRKANSGITLKRRFLLQRDLNQKWENQSRNSFKIAYSLKKTRYVNRQNSVCRVPLKLKAKYSSSVSQLVRLVPDMVETLWIARWSSTSKWQMLKLSVPLRHQKQEPTTREVALHKLKTTLTPTRLITTWTTVLIVSANHSVGTRQPLVSALWVRPKVASSEADSET